MSKSLDYSANQKVGEKLIEAIIHDPSFTDQIKKLNIKYDNSWNDEDNKQERREMYMLK